MSPWSRRPGAAAALCVVLASAVLSACGGSDSDSGAAPAGTVPAESYRQAFCGARTSFQSLVQTMGARGSAPLNQTDLTSDQQTRLVFVDGLVDAAGQIVTALTAGGAPDVQGGRAGAEATVEVYRAVEDEFAAARKDFADAAVGDRADYLAAVKKLQAALVAAANSLGTAAGKEVSEIDPAFNAILHCP
ncbi:hypothetical protein [Sporichthya sp.]|uniref:hypothetical protein n=1 Tax=Sporichthya sp. TaxID=65475 RepID=UPI0017C20987|nr:hypothetical protein [Sporichthya sp.]MBA3741921.1 hypothetical protein [Sporichthya sp.]